VLLYDKLKITTQNYLSTVSRYFRYTFLCYIESYLPPCLVVKMIHICLLLYLFEMKMPYFTFMSRAGPRGKCKKILSAIEYISR